MFSRIRAAPIAVVKTGVCRYSTDYGALLVAQLKAMPIADDQARVELIKGIAAAANPHKQVLFQHLIPDFGVYFRLGNGPIASPELLARLIDVNLGRVHLSYDLFCAYTKGRGEVSPQLVASVIKSLAKEENAALAREQLHSLLEKYGLSEIIMDAAKTLVLHWIEHGKFATVKEECDSMVLPVLFWEDIVRSDLKDASSRYGQCIIAFSLLERDQASTGALSKTLQTLNKHLQDLDAARDAARALATKDGALGHGPAAIAMNSKLLAYIKEKSLTPTSIDLRTAVVEALGIHHDNLEDALKCFHENRRSDNHDPQVQVALLKCFVYQGIAKSSPVFATVADTLVPQRQELTANVIQLMMINRNAQDEEAALKLYNDHISHVLKVPDPATHRSEAGILTETILLCSLVHHDRNFATLLFDKAVEKKIIEGQDVAAAKALFKVYGASFENDDDREKASIQLQKFLLQYIASI